MRLDFIFELIIEGIEILLKNIFLNVVFDDNENFIIFKGVEESNFVDRNLEENYFMLVF